jgi:hypothetical protein
MIRFTTFVLSILIGIYSMAQDCGSYPLLKKGSTVEYSMLGKEGNKIFTVEEVTSDSNSCRTRIQGKTPFFRKSYIENEFDVKWENNVFKMSIFAFGYGSMEHDKKKKKKSEDTDDVKEDLYLEYPDNMQVGQTFENIVADMNVLLGKSSSKVRMSIINREVIAKETITTPAGKYECFKITYEIGGKNSQVNTMDQKTRTTEWFAPGVGVVKLTVTGTGSFAEMSETLVLAAVKTN